MGGAGALTVSLTSDFTDLLSKLLHRSDVTGVSIAAALLSNGQKWSISFVNSLVRFHKQTGH